MKQKRIADENRIKKSCVVDVDVVILIKRFIGLTVPKWNAKLAIVFGSIGNSSALIVCIVIYHGNSIRIVSIQKCV